MNERASHMATYNEVRYALLHDGGDGGGTRTQSRSDNKRRRNISL